MLYQAISGGYDDRQGDAIEQLGATADRAVVGLGFGHVLRASRVEAKPHPVSEWIQEYQSLNYSLCRASASFAVVRLKAASLP
jgi:hypothetical protein